MIGFPLGVLFTNAFEWYAHKYILHGTPRPGEGRHSPVPEAMKSHWTHHKIARRSGFHEDGYVEGLGNERVRREVQALFVLAGLTTLAAPVAPFFTLGTYYGAARYFYVHRRSHLDPEWAKKNVPWHYDHHMNSNQDANWCVTRPWFDYVMGTRVVSSPDLMESNPLGMKLPPLVERPLNRMARKLSPRTFRKLDENQRQEAENRVHGVSLPIPD